MKLRLDLIRELAGELYIPCLLILFSDFYQSY